MQVNFVSVIAALMLLGGAIKGCKRGMVKELSSFISLVGALMAIALFAAAVQNYRTKDNTNMLIAILGFVIVVLAYKVIDFILTSLKLISNLPIVNWVDHLAGIAVGALESVLFIWIAFLLITAFDVFGLRIYLLSQVQDNVLLTYLFYNNYIASWIAGWGNR